MSELTAQHVLVPNLVQSLSHQFQFIIPFAFDLTREGQTKARAGDNHRVRLMGAYARRPKVQQAGGSEIAITINAVLQRHAQILWQEGIPLLVGVPLVTRLYDLRHDTACAWFQVVGDLGRDIVLHMQVSGGVDLCPPLYTVVKGPLSSNEVASTVTEVTPREWPEALALLRRTTVELRQSELIPRTMFGRHPRYKPFYVAAAG